MRIQEKIKLKSAVVGVVGLGYVGLPLAVESAKAGFDTIGFEISAEKVKKISAKTNYIADIKTLDLEKVVDNKKLLATTDFSLLKKCDCVLICVPTPLDRYRQPDLSYIHLAIGKIKENLHSDMLIILESTTYPGTTVEVLKPALERKDFICGEKFYLAFSPERVDPGNQLYNTSNTPKIVGGVTAKCTETARLFYDAILDINVFSVSSPSVAEMTKLLENIYRNINIGLINEIAVLCNQMNINIWEVIDAAKTKPFGFQAFYPGPGIGGHCIPLDPSYLAWKAKEYQAQTTMIETAGIINGNMPFYIVERIAHLLNTKKQHINGSKILIVGIAYKPNIDDCRESPSLEVYRILTEHFAIVEYYDPYISSYIFDGETIESIPTLSKKVAEGYDLVVITTDHSNIDYAVIADNSKLVFDTRNALKNIANRSNIEIL